MLQHHRTGSIYGHVVPVSAGKLLYLAGQVGTDAEGNVVGPGDAAAQTRQAFDNIGRLLARAGASFRDVVDITYFVVGRESLQPFRQARDELRPVLFAGGE